ncbi:hypothetical protein LSTR_LSTR010394 [Laodelphax striatellus]|uniref:Uncharacterized protein n=1 Tax=Laodelphax striatellus TaxID=195883 RepID=A0A482XK63_LAOST|nr:hypothetical protein LSTR_LSTR010394 [Laodelphax striatellus]
MADALPTKPPPFPTSLTLVCPDPKKPLTDLCSCLYNGCHGNRVFYHELVSSSRSTETRLVCSTSATRLITILQQCICIKMFSLKATQAGDCVYFELCFKCAIKLLDWGGDLSSNKLVSEL